MKSRQDKDLRSSGQADALLHNDWSDLQLLRHKLQVLNQPLSGSLKQLFRQEKLLQQLDVKPQAMTVPGLEESDNLRDIVPPFPSSVEEIINTAESTAQQKVARVGKPASARASGVPYATSSVDKAGYKKQEHKKMTQSRSQSAAKYLPEDTSEHKAGVHDEIQGKDLSSDLSGDSLTPEYMQQWIDEILSTDMSNKKGRSKEHGITTRSGSDKKIGSSREHTEKYRKHSANETVAIKSEQKKSKVSFLHEKKSGSQRVDQEAVRISTPVKVEKHSPSAQKSLITEQDRLPGAPPNSSAKNTKTVFDGITLLQKLVQMDKPLAAPDLAMAGKSLMSELRQGLVDNHLPLKNNTAWRQQEKSLRSASPGTQSNNDNGLTLSSVPTVSGLQNTGCQDDSERIASLVNDVLVEQAIRHGVDLS